MQSRVHHAPISRVPNSTIFPRFANQKGLFHSVPAHKHTATLQSIQVQVTTSWMISGCCSILGGFPKPQNTQVLLPYLQYRLHYTKHATAAQSWPIHKQPLLSVHTPLKIQDKVQCVGLAVALRVALGVVPFRSYRVCQILVRLFDRLF